MARAPQTTQRQAVQLLESPAVRRSRILAEMLERSRETAPDIRSGGQLAAELLAQGITQFSANRADRAVKEEQDQRLRQQVEGGSATLARLLGGPMTPDVASAPPQPSPDAPTMAAPETPGNMLTPVQSATAPIAPIQESTPPPADAATALLGQPSAPMQPAPQAVAPQAPRNPLGPTPGEAAYIQRALQSGNPELIAEGQAMLSQIEQRMIAPPEFEITTVNGVPFRVDPRTGQSVEVFQNGLPQSVQVRDEFNPEGTRAGTLGQRDPFNRLTLVEKPPEGFEASGGRLRPISGGPSDQTTGGNQITNERNLRQEYQRATENYREARNGYQKVEAAAADASGASDVALIFGFMKTLDPTSTVREGEFATAQNTGSVPERVLSAYNRALNGDRLTQAQRDEFVRTARSQFQTYEQGYQDRTSEYIRMAEQYGLNPQNIVGVQRSRDNAPRQAPTPQRQPQRQQSAPAAPRTNGVRRRYNPNTGQLE